MNINDTVFHSNTLVAQINADGIEGFDFMLVNSCSVDVSHKVILLKETKNATAGRGLFLVAIE